jgi:hypothetical protein
VLSARAPAWRALCVVATLIATGVASGGGTASAAGSSTVHVNGVPLVMRVLTVRGAPDEIAARLLARWRMDPAAQWVHEGTFGSRIVVGQRQGPVAVAATVVAAPAPGYSRVVISVTDARKPLRPPAPPGLLRSPPGLQWLSVIDSLADPLPRDSRAVPRSIEYLGVMDASPEVSRLRWIASLRRAGFALQPHAAGQIEAYRHGETMWLAFQAVGSRTSVVLQRRWSVADPP